MSNSLFPAPRKEHLLLLNAYTQSYGLSLTPEQASMLIREQEESLMRCGRVDFDGGALPRLARAFVSSSYIEPREWPQTLGRLCDLFYAFKNETRDALSDEELIYAMTTLFDGPCGGSLHALAALDSHALMHAALGTPDEQEDACENP